MKAERTQHRNRLKGLLASGGVAVQEIRDDFPEVLTGVRLWDGQAVPADLHHRLRRAFARRPFVDGRSGRWRMRAPDASVRRSPILLSSRGGNCWRARGSTPIAL